MPNPDIGPMIEHMKDHGSSLNMGWGEDSEQWEVAWITGGRRFRGMSCSLVFALFEAIVGACDCYAVEVPPVMRDIAETASSVAISGRG